MLQLILFLMTAVAAEYGPSFDGEVAAPEPVRIVDTGGAAGCSDQFLTDAHQLPNLPLFYNRIVPDSEYGTQEMVDAIIEAGRQMRWLMPEADPFLVGDISKPRGGVFPGHKTHRGGVDADIGIYSKGAKQGNGFKELNNATFDLEANWALINAFLETGKIDFILLDRTHITALHAYTIRMGILSKEEADNLFVLDGSSVPWGKTATIRHAPGHAGHLHVRVLCGDGMRARN